MRLVSFDDYEPGVIALGSFPVGILAIGTMPVGVVAVGVIPRGLLAIACGVGIGLASVSCGASFGLWSRAVGVAVGWRVGERLGHFPVVGPRPSATSERATVAVQALLDDETEGWVLAEVDASGNLVLPVGGAQPAVALTAGARHSASALRAREVFAKLTAVEPEPSPAGGYREHAAAGAPTLVCSSIEDATPLVPTPGALRFLAWTAFKALILCAALLVGGYTAFLQLRNTAMTRHAVLRWPARVIATEHKDLSSHLTCELSVEVRTDGGERLHVWPTVRCGAEELYPANRLDDCTLREQPTADGEGFSYRIRCAESGKSAGDEGSPRPSLQLDTLGPAPTLQLRSVDTPRWSVTLVLAPASEPRRGKPLFSAH